MRELTVVEIRVSAGDSPPLVVLAEVGGQGRLLPIWMSHGGASAIFTATEDVDPDRPSIYDLTGQLVEAGGEPMTSVTITAYDDGQYFAALVFGDSSFAARPSDAIALALRIGCPIRCEDDLLDQVGVTAVEDAEGPPLPVEHADDEVERFREFLDSVTPEDFTGDEGKP